MSTAGPVSTAAPAPTVGAPSAKRVRGGTSYAGAAAGTRPAASTSAAADANAPASYIAGLLESLRATTVELTSAVNERRIQRTRDELTARRQRVEEAYRKDIAEIDARLAAVEEERDRAALARAGMEQLQQAVRLVGTMPAEQGKTNVAHAEGDSNVNDNADNKVVNDNAHSACSNEGAQLPANLMEVDGRTRAALDTQSPGSPVKEAHEPLVPEGAGAEASSIDNDSFKASTDKGSYSAMVETANRFAGLSAEDDLLSPSLSGDDDSAAQEEAEDDDKDSATLEETGKND